ncbi:hypothetical protein [Nissabacter sp. SGAir0207]|uniref:hypothetical protein n=1 Tax=Nissabacter sp. SGAir0207 TaxID=2126321 RepID=UPI0010CD66B0|nr:hypothetical protein [Nissabacter sp. SGAir0207]QCR38019.1 hypothetical protein C1N62_17920 [Nissabacter sp. SGAir0207]
MDDELKAQVVLERVELIARLAAEKVVQERDREIALNLIADLAQGMALQGGGFQVAFTAKQ